MDRAAKRAVGCQAGFRIRNDFPNAGKHFPAQIRARAGNLPHRFKNGATLVDGGTGGGDVGFINVGHAFRPGQEFAKKLSGGGVTGAD